MNGASRVRWNSFFSFLTISTRLVANVLLFLLIARFYGPEVFGQFTFAHTVATLLIIFADFGFDILLTLEVAKNRENAGRIFRTFFSFKLMFSLIAVFIMWMIALFGSISTEAQQLVNIFSFFVIFTALTNFIFALFKGIELFKYETKVSLIINVALLLATLLLGWFRTPIYIIALVFVLSRMLGLLLAIFYSRKLIPEISFKPIFHDWKIYKSTIFIFGFHLLFGNLYFQLDTILLSFWRGDFEVGIYQSVFKLVVLTLIIPEVFISALMPVLSRIHSTDPMKSEKLGMLLNKTLTLIVLPISAVIFLYADQFIYFIYRTSDYSDAIPVFKIFAFILLIRFSVESFALMLTISDRQKLRMYVVITATILNFSINYFLIPEYGPIGAAITSLITSIIVGIGYIFFTYPLVSEWVFNKEFAFAIVFILIGIAMMMQFPQLPFWGAIPIFGLFYFMFIWKFLFTLDDKNIIFRDKMGLERFFKSR
ncbi:MAG: flippase [Ignavibacteriales bacterium]|jgi:O-antigen/teichoic acid export membrane protein|nr:flippase [Melioribacteraceae bacterium]RJP57680.1 MAG: flippase [Ignavibacteriales bacterium]